MSESDHKASIMRRPWPTRELLRHAGEKIAGNILCELTEVFLWDAFTAENRLSEFQQFLESFVRPRIVPN